MKTSRILTVILAALLLGTSAWAQRGGGVNVSRNQSAALDAFNSATASQQQAVTDARDALTAASYAGSTDRATFERLAAALATAETELALARSSAFTQLQSGDNRLSPDQQQLILAAVAQGGAIAAQAPGGPGGGRGGPGGGPRRKQLLIWANTRNGVSQHDFPSHAMGIIERLGRESGLWDTIIRTDSEIISYNPKTTTGGPASGGPSLANVDAIFSLVHREAPINDSQREELLRFVREGGGFLTAHTGLTAFLSWPEFREMVGGGYGGHSIGYPHTMIVEDPNFPGANAFAPRVDYSDEWYTLTDYSRDTIHVIMRIDLSDYPNPPQIVGEHGGDFPVTWARAYGEGRVFASTFAHGTETWDDPRIQTMYFEAIKWALGLTDADVTPRPLVLTPEELSN